MSAPSLIERVKTSLVALKMPRALEVLDVTLRGIERGEIGTVEAIDALLTEELTTRENRRVRMAVQMDRLSAIKTLVGFDFAFQPSLGVTPKHPLIFHCLRGFEGAVGGTNLNCITNKRESDCAGKSVGGHF